MVESEDLKDGKETQHLSGKIDNRIVYNKETIIYEKFDKERYREKIKKLFSSQCGCQRRGCLDDLCEDDFFENCLSFKKLGWEEQNYVLLGSINCGFINRFESFSTPPKNLYFILGQNVCRKVFCLYYGVSRRRVIWITLHLESNGFKEPVYEDMLLSTETKQEVSTSTSLLDFSFDF